MRSLISLAPLCFALVLLTSLPALAQTRSDEDRARSHFAAAESYFEQHRYRDAAEQFMESYRLSHHGVLLLNVATSYERIQDYPAAVEALERYLEENPEAENRHSIEGRLEEVRGLAEEQAASAGSGEGDGEEGGGEEGGAEEQPSGGLGELGMIGAIVAGVGAALGVGALATGLVALDLHASLESRCGPDGNACPAGYESDVDLGTTMSLTNTVLLPVSLAAMGAGLTLLILDLVGALGGDSEEDGEGDSEESVTLVPGPGQVGLGLRRIF